jgi:hypothetical protein
VAYPQVPENRRFQGLQSVFNPATLATGVEVAILQLCRNSPAVQIFLNTKLLAQKRVINFRAIF